MIRVLILCSLIFLLNACATSSKPMPHHMSTESMSYLQQGERYFNEGYYKRAMHVLLPLACDGIAPAQYAVGYMYYYGLGVAQDTDVGYFWIKRAADQHYARAEQALDVITHQENKKNT